MTNQANGTIGRNVYNETTVTVGDLDAVLTDDEAIETASAAVPSGLEILSSKVEVVERPSGDFLLVVFTVR